MAEWFVEEGIGETRAIRLKDGEILEARVQWPGELAAGAVVDARLASRTRGASRGVARLDDGAQALVARLPREASEGSAIRLLITRPAMAEHGRTKLAQGRWSDDTPCPAPTLAEGFESEGQAVRNVRRFPQGDWDGLLAEAFAGTIAFAGGSLALSPTPAMTLVDVDGEAEPRALALAACPAVAAALRRFDLGGSIGIDFPTLADKADRRAVGASLARELALWPHERTAMNGFGFVQIIARLERPSLLHRASNHPAATSARALLRRAEGLEGAGIIELAAHPALAAHLREDRLDELSRRTGREVHLRLEPGLAIEAAHAQFISR